jgi:hypothetical protein
VTPDSPLLQSIRTKTFRHSREVQMHHENECLRNVTISGIPAKCRRNRSRKTDFSKLESVTVRDQTQLNFASLGAKS